MAGPRTKNGWKPKFRKQWKKMKRRRKIVEERDHEQCKTFRNMKIERKSYGTYQLSYGPTRPTVLGVRRSLSTVSYEIVRSSAKLQNRILFCFIILILLLY